MRTVQKRPPRLPDGSRIHVRSGHFSQECDGIITRAEYDDGWLYRIEVTAGDRLDKQRNEDGELWVCDFEVSQWQPEAEVGR